MTMTIPSGAIGVALLDIARANIPVTTPLVQMLPRAAGTGNPGEYWQAITGFTSPATAPGMPRVVSYGTTTMHTEYHTINAQDKGERLADYQDPVQFIPLLKDLQTQEEAARFADIATQARATDAAATLYTAQHERLTDDLDFALTIAYRETLANPDYLLMSPRIALRLTKEVLLAESGRVDVEELRHTRITHFLNKVTAREIPVFQSTCYPDDTILAISLALPYPVEGVPHGVDVACNQEYWGVCYTYPADPATLNAAVYLNTLTRVHWLGGVVLLTGVTA